MSRSSAIRPIRLGPRQKRWVYLIGGLLWLSGLGWLVAHFGLASPGEFGDPHHASEPWWLRLHGAAAMAALVMIGSLLFDHAWRAWQLRKNHRSGLLLASFVIAMVLTGYALYYFGGEQARPWISMTHWLVGLGSGVLLPVHVALGRRAAR